MNVSSADATGGYVCVKVDGCEDGCSVRGAKVADAGGGARSGAVSGSCTGKDTGAAGVSGSYVVEDAAGGVAEDVGDGEDSAVYEAVSECVYDGDVVVIVCSVSESDVASVCSGGKCSDAVVE